MNSLTEKEYFDKYYPKEYGCWEKQFNHGLCVNSNKTGCSWINYNITGVVLIENKCEIYKILKRKCKDKIIESILIQGSKESCGFINPFYQPIDNSYWSQVVVKKFSKQDKFTIRVFGGDDISYEKEVRYPEEVIEEIFELKSNISYVKTKESLFKFTN